MTDSIDLGGSGGQAFSWGAQGTQPGVRVAGRVLGLAEVQATDYQTGKPETWDNGDPKMQYRVTLQTDLRDPSNPTDAGVRDVYLDGSRKQRDNGTKSRLCAVLDAVRAVTGGTSLAVGGYLELVWVSGMGFSGDPRNYEARYMAPQIELGGQAQQAAPPAAAAPPRRDGYVQAAPVQQVPAAFGSPIQQAMQAPAFAQQQVQAYAGQIPVAQPGQVGPTTAADPFGTGIQISVPAPVQQQLVQTEQGPVNPGTGEIVQQSVAPPPGITAEAVAAVKAGGMDPHAVWPGVDLTAFGV